MKKIFVIGPNKCGSSSIHHFFESNGITSAHWGGGDAESNLAYRMKLNCEKGLPVLNGMEEVTAFSDFNYFGSDRYIIGGTDLFENLYAEYPDAYYILNTRPTEKWLLSRLRHSDIAERTMKLLNLDLVELIKFWIDEKENHEFHMAKFFQNKSLVI